MFSWLFNTISSMSASDFLRLSSVTMIVVAIPTFLALLFIKAPYGRYSTTTWGPLIPARIGWIFMESINIWIVIFVSVYFDEINMKPSVASTTFCTWNATNQALSLLIVNEIPLEYVYNPQFSIGVVLFLFGFFMNVYSDSVLINLRKPGDKPGTYKIPKGWAYEYISCPNYAGEILEWIGFAIASNYSLSAVAFAVYTFANLAPRALKHHQWYLSKFEDYPKKRKAIIPFVM